MNLNLKKTSIKSFAIAITLFSAIGRIGFTNGHQAIAFASKGNTKIYQQKSTYKINSIKYVDKSSKISYPQISNLSNINKQKIINQIIKNDVLKVQNTYKSIGQEFSLEINYSIKLNKPNVLSIRYFGYGNVKGSAHPSNLLFTTNININNASRIKLTDLVYANLTLAKKLRTAKYVGPYKINSELKSAINNYLGQLTNNDLIRMFKTADSAQAEAYSYLTNDSLVISIPISHVLGDYAEFEINYKDITKDMRTKNLLWKEL